jgi:hypothetical protein
LQDLPLLHMVAVVCAVLQHACVIATKDAITYETTKFSNLLRCSSSELVLLHEMTDTNTINVINANICAIKTQKSGPYEVKCELFNDRIQVLYEVDPLALNIISLILIHISQCCGQLS